MAYGFRKSSRKKAPAKKASRSAPSSRRKVPRKFKTSRYKSNARNNKTAIVAIQKDIRRLKSSNNMVFHQDYYDSQLATTSDQSMDTSKFHLIHEALTEFTTYTKMFDKYEQWDEGPTVFIKNIRLNYFLRMRATQVMASPIEFTIFIYSPKPIYKKVGSTPFLDVPNPSNWVKRREYFYDNDPRNTINGAVNVMLNPEYFTVHVVRKIRISANRATVDPYTSGSSAAVNLNTDPMDTLRNGVIKLKVNKEYNFTANSATDTDNWTNINNSQITLSKQFYITVFHTGINTAYGESSTPPAIDFVLTNRATVKHMRQKSKNVINNEVDAAP